MTSDSASPRKASELARLKDIRRIGTDRAQEAADTLLDAFADDPFMLWMLEGSAETEAARHAKHRQYWLWCCQNILPAWEMHALGDLSAVALWYPLLEVPVAERLLEERQGVRSRQAAGTEQAVKVEQPAEAHQSAGAQHSMYMFEEFCQQLLGRTHRFQEFLEVLAQCKQVMEATLGSQSAWYLAAVGVRNDLKGRGIGNQLLRAMLRRCDRLGLPAYLESSTQRNVPFYQRLGFELLPNWIEVPGGQPLLPMLRQPESERGG